MSVSRREVEEVVDAGELDPWIKLEGPLNFRDLGGYSTISGQRVRPRLVYRADNLALLTATDVTRLEYLGLRTVIDLRSAEEAERLGRFPVDQYSQPVTYTHLSVVEDVVGVRDPSVDDQTYLNSRYQHLMERGSATISSIFHIFAKRESYPLVFHCVAGKDRTGVVAALLLDLLGVPDETIAADYQLTDRATRAWFERMQRTRPEEIISIRQLPQILFSSNPQTILFLLDRIRKSSGSVEEWLMTLGITTGEIRSIRDLLLGVAESV
ncbi:tyrosine-protein phosphatase [Ferrimicrobium acidiphilum]|uniref:tyrosine-protein phosphatase n=1 Tax=Ferrimicrobium acidiphilum TaxID=121039 RepID=UPI00069800EB|nr:tyrosine-protein phosphatase [Ferrimicrobium acidiphilum]